MAFEHELQALAASADQQRRRTLMARWRLLWKRSAILSYRKLFVGPDGRVHADGARVLADIAGISKLGVADMAAVTDPEMRERAGRRQLALHIIARLDLDGSTLRDLSTRLKELDA